MSEAVDQSEKRSSWVKKLGIGLGALLLLLVIGYFVISSSAFVKGVILPQVSKAMNGQVTAGAVSLSPFSQVVIDHLEVRTTGSEPLLTSREVRVRYKLFSVLGGNMELDEVSLADPIINIVTEADGTSNLDPVLQATETPPSSKETAPTQASISNINLRNATVRMTEKAHDGSVQTTEFKNLDLAVDRLQNGQPGKLKIAGLLQHTQKPAPPAPSSSLQGRIEGAFDFTVDPELMPNNVQGNTRIHIAEASGDFADAASLAIVLQADVTPKEVRQLAIRFEKDGNQLGQVAVSGPVDLDTLDGRLKISVQSINRQVLNLAGASYGIDFGGTEFNATNVVDFTKSASNITASGRVTGSNVSIRQDGKTSPALDLSIDYQVSVNLDEKNAVIQKLNLNGMQKQQPIIKAGLNRPMHLTWGAASRGFTESTFELALTQFNLQDWADFLGTNSPSGKVNLDLNIVARNDGKLFNFRLDSQVSDLRAQMGTNTIRNMEAKLVAAGTIENYEVINLSQYQATLRQPEGTLASVNGSGRADLARQNYGLSLSSEASLPALLRQFPQPDMAASSGVLKVNTGIESREGRQQLTGSVVLSDFAGQYAEYHFTNYNTILEYSVEARPDSVKINRANVSIRQGYQPGGAVGLSGTYGLTNEIADLAFQITDLNQNALRPLMAPSLGDNKLVSIALNGGGSLRYDPRADTAVKTDMMLTNWVVESPLLKDSRAPLNARLLVDVSQRQDILQLNRMALHLSPTDRASNQVEITGKVDLAATNATPSQLSVRAHSLDVTPYYDIFEGQPSAATGTPSHPAPAPATGAAQPQSEPEPIELPIQQLTADVRIGEFYLREIAITNLNTDIKVDRGEISLNPIDLTLNGTPVQATANVNVKVPGYRYSLSASGSHIPVEPLVNSLSPDMKGELKGSLSLNAQIKGAGVTGTSLQKTLEGHTSLSITNMHYELVGPKVKRLLDPIALVLRLPELTQTPVEWINAKTDIGNGMVNVQEMAALSPVFYANARGQIRLADVLTNSPINMPVEFALLRSLAEKANLVPADAPTNTTYVTLPTFVTLSGTVGDPRTEINKLVISGLLLRSAGKAIPGVNEKTGNLIQGIGNLLSGQGQTAPQGTNAPPAAGQTPQTNNPPNQISPLDLLRLLPQKK